MCKHQGEPIHIQRLNSSQQQETTLTLISPDSGNPCCLSYTHSMRIAHSYFYRTVAKRDDHIRYMLMYIIHLHMINEAHFNVKKA